MSLRGTDFWIDPARLGITMWDTLRTAEAWLEMGRTFERLNLRPVALVEDTDRSFKLSYGDAVVNLKDRVEEELRLQAELNRLITGMAPRRKMGP